MQRTWDTEYRNNVIARKPILAAALAALGALSLPVASQGAVTIGGDTSTPAPGIAGCSIIPSDSCTFVQAVDPTAPVTAPFDGVIVSWRVRGNSFAARLSLRVVQAAGGTSYTGIATGVPEAVLPGIENVFEARLPIKQGQGIGIDVPGAAGTPRIETRNVTGATNLGWTPPPMRLADNETRAANASAMNTQIPLNATVEPDCDDDGFGDETQDPSLFGGSCPALDRALTLDASKSKVKRKKKVTFSGLVNATGDEGGCRAGQTVELQRKRPSQAEFTTFATLQTTATGAFSLIQKIKKTFEYRAQLAASPGCNAGTSTTERVKAKKPKK